MIQEYRTVLQDQENINLMILRHSKCKNTVITCINVFQLKIVGIPHNFHWLALTDKPFFENLLCAWELFFSLHVWIVFLQWTRLDCQYNFSFFQLPECTRQTRVTRVCTNRARCAQNESQDNWNCWDSLHI